MGTIVLDGVSKAYGELVAVDDLDLEIADGSYTMILGPSGCGKSTTLRMIAGLEQPTDGDVIIDDDVVTDEPARERNLSMVFQNLALWSHKTVRGNMEFGLKMNDVPASVRRERVEEIAEVLHIADKLDQHPDQLSGGQQQRVALGRSLVREPEIVLLDEPLSSLDAKLRIEMRTELARIQNRLDTTFVHVTHNQEDAMSIADEILLLRAGKLQQFGDPYELFSDPNNEFVADFIGTPSMNIFDASVRDGVGITFNAGDLALSIPPAASDPFGAALRDGQVRVGIRPSNLRPRLDGEAEEPSFEAVVEIVETYGDENWYFLEVGLTEPLVMKSADERVISTLSAGDRVTVSVPPESIHVFEPGSGEALV